MTTKICYYQVLGIQKSANQDQIKKAYRKLAVKWHPDKNLDKTQIAKQKFRQISEAYQNLSDKQKRKVYDLYGHQGPRSSGSSGFQHHKFNFTDAQDIFKHFFEENPFDDDFFTGFFGKKKDKSNKSSGFGSRGFGESFGGDPFPSCDFGRGFGGGFGGGLFRTQSLFDSNDHFFNSGFGGNNSGSLFRSSSFGADFHNDDLDSHPGLKKSVSTTTKTVNGKTVTTKKTTVINTDGSKQITQQVIEGGISSKKMYSLGPGQNPDSKSNRIKYH